MSQSIEEILLRVGLDSSSVKTGMNSLNNTVSDSAKRIASSIVQAFSFSMILGGMNRIIEKFDDLQDRADNLGAGTDFLQGVQQVAKKNAVGGVETFNKSIAELSVRLGAAKDGSKDAVAAFEKFGITLSDIKTLNTEDMFYRIADTIAAIEDPAKRSAAAFELLGKSGKNMVGILAGGSGELKKQIGDVPKLSSADVKVLADAKDVIDDTTNSVEILGAKLTVGLAAWPKFIRMMLGGPKADIQKYIDAGTKTGNENYLRHQAAVDAEIEAEETDKAAKAAAARADADKKSSELRARDVENANLLAKAAKEEADIKKDLNGQWNQRDKLLTAFGKVGQESVSVEDLAGRGYMRQLNQAYGEGGKYDLGAGDGKFAGIAQEYARVQMQQKWDIIHGNAVFDKNGVLTGGSAYDAKKREIQLGNMLGAAGLDTPAMKFEAMKQNLDDINNNITDLLKLASDKGIVISDK